MRIPGLPFLFRVAEELRSSRERERVGVSGRLSVPEYLRNEATLESFIFEVYDYVEE